MEKNSKVLGQTLNTPTEKLLAIELFLNENYRFRRNILNGKVEFAVLPKAENKAEGNEGCLNRMGEMTGEIKGISPVLNPLCTKAFRKMTGEMMDFP
jgi:hypothetical protein